MESLAFATASSFISGIGHSAAYQVAGKLLLVMEGIVTMEVSHPDVKKVLIELDIKASVTTIKALLEDLQPVLPKCGSTLKVCVDNLEASMTQIQQQLDVVEKKCEAHKKSWSAYIYTNPDVTTQLNEIRNLKKIMDHRIELLTKSATIELQLMSINTLSSRQVVEQAPSELQNDQNDTQSPDQDESKQDLD